MGDLHSVSREKTNEPLIRSSEQKPPQPIVKWAGGKRWLANRVKKLKPEKWQGRYYEPFFGGGAMFFALQPERATLSDANKELIATYTAVRNDPKGVIALLNSYTHDEGFFYKLRNRVVRS